MLHLKDLECTKIVQEEQLVVPWIRKRTDPYVLAKSAESRDSKGLPERSWAEERARVRKSLILKDRKNAEEFSTARVMFTPAEGKEVEFRLMEK